MRQASLIDEDHVTYDFFTKPGRLRRTIVRVFGKRIGRVETETIYGDGGAAVEKRHVGYLDTDLREPATDVFTGRTKAVRALVEEWGKRKS